MQPKSQEYMHYAMAWLITLAHVDDPPTSVEL